MLVVPINRTETQTNEEVCPKEDTPEAPSKNTVSQIHIVYIYIYKVYRWYRAGWSHTPYFISIPITFFLTESRGVRVVGAVAGYRSW